MGAENQGFLEWSRSHPGALDEESIDTIVGLRNPGAPGDTWVWKQGRKREQTFDFATFFPIDNGGEPPYFRQRPKVARSEAADYFEYRENGGTGDFEPFPLPTPERLQRLAEDD